MAGQKSHPFGPAVLVDDLTLGWKMA